jgi:hypothetical protein
MAIRLATLPVREVMELTGVRSYPRWAGGVTVDDGLIERHLANDELIAPEEDRDPNAPVPAAEHAGRIAWLIRNVRPNRCSVTIRDGHIQDGNHRFAAALYRGDDLVSCCIME